ncbi:MAG: galactokinase [Oscillospiraceae bacterium]|nr:galactokinase [Oscillospiraceae bacterium]
MNQMDTIRALQSGAYDSMLRQMYACSGDALMHYRQRLIDAVTKFGEEFGTDGDVLLFSAPGRTELCGNHTDHQNGCVLTGSVNLDIIAVASPRDNHKIRLKSEGYLMDSVELTDLSPQPDEAGSSAALLRGIAARFQSMGFPVTGFDAYTVSDVLRGSGLSSSAAFEVLCAKICNVFFAKDSLDAVALAQIGQYAENAYFGKPCGLMDQMGCAVGGVIAIDFQQAAPSISRTSVDLAKEGYALCILDTGADHANLTEAYAAIPSEMSAIAQELGCPVLAGTSREALLAKLPELRKRCGDRAVLRALHFFSENGRVKRAVHSLKSGYFSQYLEEIKASGRSSAEFLQNCSTFADPRRQEVTLTIALCSTLLHGRGAVRVHGGGFAGTVQAYVPLDILDDFRTQTEAVLGEGHCRILQIRSIGVTEIRPAG